MGIFDFLFGDDEEEELPEGYSIDPETGAVTVVIQRPEKVEEAPEPVGDDVFPSPFMIPATSAYDTFIEGPSLRTGTEDVFVAAAPTPSLETYADEPKVMDVPYPSVPLFRQVGDYTAEFAKHIPGLDPERAKMVVELSQVAEQEVFLIGKEGVRDPGMMLRQSQVGKDPRQYPPEEFGTYPRTAPWRHEVLIKDLKKSIEREPAIDPEDSQALMQRLDEDGLLRYLVPGHETDDEGKVKTSGAYGTTQMEDLTLLDAVNHMRKNPNDSAVLRAYFTDEGLDMGDLQSEEGRKDLVREMAYRLETDTDPAFHGAVNAMHLMYKQKREGDMDFDIDDHKAVIDYVEKVQRPNKKDIEDYRMRLRRFLTQ